MKGFASVGCVLAVLVSFVVADESTPRLNPTVKAVQKVKPSVVHIKTLTSNGKETSGSGTIIDKKGFIVTVRHIVGLHKTARVSLLDKTEYTATVLIADPTTDLAILRIKADKDLPAYGLTTSADLLEGEDVMAVGHPYGYVYTVTKGIVSATRRTIEMPNGYVLTDLVQTSTPINPGNSGGPLVNINGEIIGINVALRDGAQGIAFAISTDTVKKVLDKYLGNHQITWVVHKEAQAKQVINAVQPAVPRVPPRSGYNTYRPHHHKVLRWKSR